MAETTILLAQAGAPATSADAVQNGVVVGDTPVAEVHATTETAHEAVGFPPFDASTFASQFLWMVIAFGLLYVLMSRLALPQIGSIIDKRKARIEGDLKEAERLRGETDKAIAAYEQALAEARRNAHAIAEETRTSIKADLDGKRKGVEDDLSRKVAEAETRIRANKADALGRVGEIAEETTAALVSRLIGEVKAKDVADAVAEAIKE